jgi:hypothetical protein
LTGSWRHLLQRRGEVLEDDDRLGAGILELVLELARRIERIDVDHRQPARSTPIIATGYCSTFGIMIATRAPFSPLDCRKAPNIQQLSRMRDLFYPRESGN